MRRTRRPKSGGAERLGCKQKKMFGGSQLAYSIGVLVYFARFDSLPITFGGSQSVYRRASFVFQDLTVFLSASELAYVCCEQDKRRALLLYCATPADELDCFWSCSWVFTERRRWWRTRNTSRRMNAHGISRSNKAVLGGRDKKIVHVQRGRAKISQQIALSTRLCRWYNELDSHTGEIQTRIET